MPDSSLTTHDSSRDLTGCELGDYRLLRRLGRGGMADVYLAEQLSLRRNVALKVLKAELAVDESYVRRFEREAQAAAALVQANIVQIYEVGHREGIHYIAQEYVRGRNLKQYLDRHGAVEPVMAINVLRQAALALQKAGELGVVHRDIKPENIMLSTKGEVKITDFGLARVTNQASDQALTQIGVTMGTPLYMSPEQVGGMSIDHRSDIYSLGVTAYHMLAGEPPFNGETALAIAVQQVNNEPPDLAKLRPDIPESLVQVVKTMMAKKPRDRYADPKELLKAIRAIKIEVDEDWEMIVEKLSVSELANVGAVSISMSQAQLAATRQLQRVMQGHTQAWWRSRPLWIAAVLMGMLGLVSGAMLARRTRPESLLNVTDINKERIPRESDIERQYHLALIAPMDQHETMLLKVIEYFPLEQAATDEVNRTQLYHRRTMSRLGEWYLINRRWNDARQVFTKLSKVEDLAEQFQVTGFAGLAITYFNMTPNEFPQGAAEQQEKIADAVRGVDGRQAMLNSMLAEEYADVVADNDILAEISGTDETNLGPEGLHTPRIEERFNNAN